MKDVKKYGLVRRVDELGRIVIPKEIRSVLNLQENDPLEISIINRGIYMEKYQTLRTLDTLCEQYLSALFKTCGVACTICSTEHVIASRGIHLSTKQPLAEGLQNRIYRLETYHYSEESLIPLFCDGKYPIDTLYPVGTKERPLGAVILLHYRSTTQEERSCAKLIAGLLTELTMNECY